MPSFSASAADVVALVRALGPAALAPVMGMGGSRGVVTLTAEGQQVTASAWAQDAFLQMTVPATVHAPGRAVVNIKALSTHVLDATGTTARARTVPAALAAEQVHVRPAPAAGPGCERVEVDVAGRVQDLAHEPARWLGMGDLTPVSETLEVSTAALATSAGRVAACADSTGYTPVLELVRVRVGERGVNLLTTDQYQLGVDLVPPTSAGAAAPLVALIGGLPARELDSQAGVEVCPRAEDLPRLVKVMPEQYTQVSVWTAPTPFTRSERSDPAVMWLRMTSGPVLVLTPGLSQGYPKVAGILVNTFTHEIVADRPALLAAAVDASAALQAAARALGAAQVATAKVRAAAMAGVVRARTKGLSAGQAAAIVAGGMTGVPDPVRAEAAEVARERLRREGVKHANARVNGGRIVLSMTAEGLRVEADLNTLAEQHAGDVVPANATAATRGKARERARQIVAQASEGIPTGVGEGPARVPASAPGTAMGAGAAWHWQRLPQVLSRFTSAHVVLHLPDSAVRPMMITNADAHGRRRDNFALLLMPMRPTARA